MDKNYIQQLKDIEILLTNESLSSSVHQDLICGLCGDTFNATPKSKWMNYKKYGMKGCPKCTHKVKHSDTTVANIAKLSEKFDILEMDVNNFGNHQKIKVRNKICGHEFISKTDNLLNGSTTYCPVCNTDIKRSRMQSFNN